MLQSAAEGSWDVAWPDVSSILGFVHPRVDRELLADRETDLDTIGKTAYKRMYRPFFNKKET